MSDIIFPGPVPHFVWIRSDIFNISSLSVFFFLVLCEHASSYFSVFHYCKFLSVFTNFWVRFYIYHLKLCIGSICFLILSQHYTFTFIFIFAIVTNCRRDQMVEICGIYFMYFDYCFKTFTRILYDTFQHFSKFSSIMTYC